MKDLMVTLEDRPGTFSDMSGTLENANINIEGFCGVPIEGKGQVHILVENEGFARETLEAAGFHVEEREVLVVNSKNRPGSLREICAKIASSGVNINLMYLASDDRLIFGVDDLDKAKSAL